jgi:hypothetical protein
VRRTATEWPFVLVLTVALVGVAVIAFLDRFRRGSVLLGGSLALGGLLRLLLPDRTAGLLAVRAKPLDVLTYITLGAAVAVLAVVTPAGAPA